MKKILALMLTCSTMWVSAQVTEEMKVIYRDIRVHVVDKDGFPVKGLTRDDFILKQDGDVQELQFFEEVNLNLPLSELQDNYAEQMAQADESDDGPAQLMVPTGLEPRYKVLFLDSSQMRPEVFASVKEAVVKFIQEQTTELDFIKIVHMDRRLTHLTDFTQDKNELISSLERAPYHGELLRSLRRVQSSIRDAIIEWDLAEGLSSEPYERLTNELVKEKARVKKNFFMTYYYNMLSMGLMMEYIKGPKSIFLFTSGSYVELGSFGNTSYEAEKLTRVLNRANTTVYSILFKPRQTIGGDPAGLELRFHKGGFLQRLANTSTFPPNEMNSFEATSNTIFENNYQLETAPAGSAERTGGLFFRTFSDENAEGQLNRMNNLSNHYYRLVYALSEPERRDRIKVQLANPQRGWDVLYGAEFEPADEYNDMKRDERRVAFSAMLAYGRNYRDDLGAEWEYHLFNRKGGGYSVPLLGRFPMDKLPEEGVEFGLVALDENRRLLDITSQVLTEFPENKEVPFYDVLLTDKPPAYLRLAVRNMDTNELTFIEKKVKAEEVPKDGEVRISDVFISGPTINQPLAINHIRYMNLDRLEDLLLPKDQRKKRSVMEEDPTLVNARRDNDPFKMQDLFFKPAPSPAQLEPGPLWFMFHLENATENNYVVQFFVRSNDKTFNPPGRIVKTWDADETSIHYQGELLVNNLPPGQYELWVRALHPRTKESHIAKADFVLAANQ